MPKRSLSSFEKALMRERRDAYLRWRVWLMNTDCSIKDWLRISNIRYTENPPLTPAQVRKITESFNRKCGENLSYQLETKSGKKRKTRSDKGKKRTRSYIS